MHMNYVKAYGSCAANMCSRRRAGVLHVRVLLWECGQPWHSSANCGITELAGLEGTSGHHQSHLLPRQGQVTRGHVQLGLECLHRGRLHDVPGLPVPGLCCPQWKETLPHVELKLPANSPVSPAQFLPTCFQSKRQDC